MGELFNGWIVASVQGERAVLLGDFVNEVLHSLLSRLSIGCERRLLDFRDTSQSLDQLIHGFLGHSGFLGHLLKAVCPFIRLGLGFFLAVAGFLESARLILDRLNFGSHTVDKPAVRAVQHVDFAVSIDRDFSVLFDGLIEAVGGIGASQLRVNQAALGGILRSHRVGGLIDGLLALALGLYRALGLRRVLPGFILGALEFLGLLLQAGRDLFNIRIELVLSVGIR